VTGAGWALAALLAAVVLSLTSRVNVGVVAVALAWLAGTFGARLGAEAVLAGFPGSLFVTLLGVTLLFAAAEANGTLAALAARVVGLARGDARLLPWLLFAGAALLSSLGPGAVPTVALVAPLAMAAGGRAGVSPFLTALMVCNGANAGNLSPVSAVGVVAGGVMARVGLGGHAVRLWLANAAAHAVATAVAYLLLRRRAAGAVDATGAPVAGATPGATPGATLGATPAVPPLGRAEGLTLLVMAAWVAGLLVWRWPLGPSACAAAALLIAARLGDEAATLRRVPWGAIVMVCGVSMLVALLERTGGMPLFAALLARLATPATLDGTIALVTGAVSAWSSTSGVVIPAFLPTAPALVAQTGGGDPLAVSLSIAVGSHLVDVSPLSTLGALCVATLADPAAQRTLFRRLLVWGLTMIAGGALLCQFAAGWVARL
jgi:Na+/H+ antiporter NhaD/arsenite permease-like protein